MSLSLLEIARRAFLRLPPETAHEIAIHSLKQFQAWGQVRLQQPNPVVVAGIRFPSRIGLAAGFDKNAEVFPAIARLGFGFAEVGTVTPLAQPGNPRPRIFRIRESKALVNQLGFNNHGLEKFRASLEALRPKAPGFPVLANIGKGKNTPVEQALSDYLMCARQVSAHCDGLVINISSPNTPGLRSLQEESFLERLSQQLPEGKPIFLKFAPDLSDTDLEALCRVVEREAKFTGVVVTNTSRALAQSIGVRSEGGLSGRPLFDRSLECVRIARRTLGLQKVVIGVGGIDSVDRARQMRRAGADLLEVYTAFIYEGPKLIEKLSRQVS